MALASVLSRRVGYHYCSTFTWFYSIFVIECTYAFAAWDVAEDSHSILGLVGEGECVADSALCRIDAAEAPLIGFE